MRDFPTLLAADPTADRISQKRPPPSSYLPTALEAQAHLRVPTRVNRRVVVPRVFERVGDRWEVAVAASDDGFTQVSFVNSIATSKGGTHVGHVTDQVRERAGAK
eukprot:4641736-Pleurochrysis_carterae.AAC.1